MARDKKVRLPDPKILRLLDANLNRCREGLRVLEDTSRFIWENKFLFAAFRKERHRVDRLTRSLYLELLNSRDSESDSGRPIKEKTRDSFESVLWANSRRCEESLRVLEEYGKLFSGSTAAEFKQIRFRMYTLEKKVLEIVKEGKPG